MIVAGAAGKTAAKNGNKRPERIRVCSAMMGSENIEGGGA